MIKRIILGLILLGGVAGITFAGLKPHPPKPVDVELAKVTRESITRTVSAAGKIQSATTVKINSNLSGELVELNVKDGDIVHKGMVLGRIDPTRYKAEVKNAQAQLSAAQADLVVEKVAVAHAQADDDRITALNAKGLASGAEVEGANSTLQGERAKVESLINKIAQAQANLDEQKDFLSKTVLDSPIEGQVIELDRQLGERVRGSDFNEDVVMVLATLSQMEVKVEVGEHEIVYLHQGDKAEVEVDALEGKKFPGSVIEIGQNAIVKNPGTEQEVTSFPIRVALDSRPPGALPGMSGTVHVATETHDKVLVLPIQCVTVRPQKAIAKAPGPSETQLKVAGAAPVSATAAEDKNQLAKVVFVVHDGKAEMREVHTGLSSETSVEISDGLIEGDTVVEGPYRTLAKDLKDGDNVEENKPGTSKGGEKS